MLTVTKSIRDNIAEFERRYPSLAGALALWDTRVQRTVKSPGVLAAHCLDPFFFRQVQGMWVTPMVGMAGADVKQVMDLVESVFAGPRSGKEYEARRKQIKEELGRLQLAGVPSDVWHLMAALTRREEKEVPGRGLVVEMASVRERISFWRLYMSEHGFPAVAWVAERFMRMHASSGASERNWSLWGNVFTKARSRLGKERAEKLIYVRGNSITLSRDARMTDEQIVLSLLGDEEEE